MNLDRFECYIEKNCKLTTEEIIQKAREYNVPSPLFENDTLIVPGINNYVNRNRYK
jgi:hypothetical protein